jgi:hypothetical protein
MNFFTKEVSFKANKLELVTIMTGMLSIGGLLGVLLAGFVAASDDEVGSVPLPFKTAVEFKENFDIDGIVGEFFPKTQSVVHNYAKLKKYVEDLQKLFDSTKPADTTYQPGLALYFGKSYKKHFVKEIDQENGCYPCALKKRYTAMLVPAYYKLRDDYLLKKDVRPITDEQGRDRPLPDTIKIKVIYDLKDAFVKVDTSDLFYKFIERSKRIVSNSLTRSNKFTNANGDSQIFDLGHTHP